MGVAATIFGYFPLNGFYLVLFLMAVVAYQVNKVFSPIHNKLSQVTDEIDSIAAIISLIEKEKKDIEENRVIPHKEAKERIKNYIKNKSI